MPRDIENLKDVCRHTLWNDYQRVIAERDEAQRQNLASAKHGIVMKKERDEANQAVAAAAELLTQTQDWRDKYRTALSAIREVMNNGDDYAQISNILNISAFDLDAE